MVAKFSACCLRASSTTSPAPGAIHWRRLPPISMLNSGPHESFDAAQMSAADHAALRARLLALFPVPGALPGVDDVSVLVIDAAGAVAQSNILITVLDTAPTITSNGGGDA